MITTGMIDWKDVLDRTGIEYEQLYGRLIFVIGHSGKHKLSNVEVTVHFEKNDPFKFIGISQRKLPNNEWPQLKTDILVFKWMSLLKNSGIHYTNKAFRAQQWATRWVEFSVPSSDKSDPALLCVAYNARDKKVFNLTSMEM